LAIADNINNEQNPVLVASGSELKPLLLIAVFGVSKN